MRSYTFVLSSDQKQALPEILNHYLFEDPIYGISFVYPNTANGSLFHTTTGSYTYPTTAYGGLIYPWGYVVQTTRTNLSAGPFKGPYTINFSPSGIDTRFFNILKIVYDFDNNEELLNVEKDIVPNLRERFLQAKDPVDITPGRIYYPSRELTTFHPTITVINSNLTQNIYNINFSLVPESVYEYGTLKVLNALQPGVRSTETMCMFEIEGSDFVTNVRMLSTSDTKYSEGVVYNPRQYGDLALWLDASDSLTLERDSNYKIQSWQDKSGNNNDFFQVSATNKPLFIYAKQTSSVRKGARFSSPLIDSVDKKYLTCKSNSLFESVTGGYTLAMVLNPCSLSGTLISQTNNTLKPGVSTVFSFVSPYGVSITQGTSSSSTIIDRISLNLSGYNIFTFTIPNTATFNASFDAYNLTIPNRLFETGGSGGEITIGPLLSTEISEILLYKPSLSEANLNNLKSDLSTKWGITYRTD